MKLSPVAPIMPQDCLHLFTVLGFDDCGVPQLHKAPPVGIVIASCPVGLSSPVAVCRIDAGGRVIVLSYASSPARNPTAPEGVAVQDDCVTIGIGQSQLFLHADGRIRIEGADIRIDAHGRLCLGGAYIDLN